MATTDVLPDYDCTLLYYGTVLRKVETMLDDGGRERVPYRRPWQDCFLILRGTKLDVFALSSGAFHHSPARNRETGCCEVGPDGAIRQLGGGGGGARNRSASTVTISDFPSIPDRPLRTYSLYGCAAGVASDYIKRPNVLRVRLENEQFLLQCRNSTACVSWLSALHQAADLSEPLESREEFKPVVNPRRRTTNRQLHEVFEARRSGSGSGCGGSRAGDEGTDQLRRRTFYNADLTAEDLAPRAARPARPSLVSRRSSRNAAAAAAAATAEPPRYTVDDELALSSSSSTSIERADSVARHRPLGRAATEPLHGRRSMQSARTASSASHLSPTDVGNGLDAEADVDLDAEADAEAALLKAASRRSTGSVSGYAAEKDGLWRPTGGRKTERYICAILPATDRRHTPRQLGMWLTDVNDPARRTLVVAP